MKWHLANCLSLKLNIILYGFAFDAQGSGDEAPLFQFHSNYSRTYDAMSIAGNGSNASEFPRNVRRGRTGVDDPQTLASWETSAPGYEGSTLLISTPAEDTIFAQESDPFYPKVNGGYKFSLRGDSANRYGYGWDFACLIRHDEKESEDFIFSTSVVGACTPMNFSTSYYSNQQESGKLYPRSLQLQCRQTEVVLQVFEDLKCAKEFLTHDIAYESTFTLLEYEKLRKGQCASAMRRALSLSGESYYIASHDLSLPACECTAHSQCSSGQFCEGDRCKVPQCKRADDPGCCYADVNETTESGQNQKYYCRYGFKACNAICRGCASADGCPAELSCVSGQCKKVHEAHVYSGGLPVRVFVCLFVCLVVSFAVLYVYRKKRSYEATPSSAVNVQMSFSPPSIAKTNTKSKDSGKSNNKSHASLRKRNRWGDGLDAPRAGARSFFQSGWIPTKTVREAIGSFGHSDSELDQLEIKGVQLSDELKAAEYCMIQSILAACIFAFSEENDYNIYGKLGRSMRTPGALEEHRLKTMVDYIYYLDQAVSALQNFVGKTYRGIRVKVPSTSYIVGSIITWQSFSSSSRQQSECLKFLDVQGAKVFGTFFVLHGRSGKDIEPFSDFPEEEEVLFSFNTNWKVVQKLSTMYEKNTHLDDLALRGYDLSDLDVYVLEQH